MSCSFDHTVKVWDVPTATNKQSTGSGALSTALCTFRAKGLANTVECVPSGSCCSCAHCRCSNETEQLADDHIVLVGTSRNAILAADCREGAMAFTMENDCSVNSLYVHRPWCALSLCLSHISQLRISRRFICGVGRQ